MAYQNLYRTYRPQNFTEVAGQKYILKSLKNAINENKLSHAYIFCGPRGTGKTTLARLLAKGANCTSESEKPCNKCNNCVAFNSNSHPDVIELDAASYNSVEDIRDIIDKVKYTPILGKYKVYIVDEIHMLSNAAYNAFLKTLEEPPEHIIFILATTEIHKVLPTILSRCQRFDFNKITSDDIVKRLEAILKREKIEYDINAVKLIASLSDGALRDALSILDQTIAYAGNQIKEDDVKDIYGITSIKDKCEFLTIIANKDINQAFKNLEDFHQKGIDLIRFTNDLINCLKDVVVYNTTKNSKILTTLDSEAAITLRKVIATVECLKMIDFLVEAIENFKKSTAVKSFLEIAILKMCQINENIKTYIEPLTELKIKSEEVKSVPSEPKIINPPKNESKQLEVTTNITPPIEDNTVQVSNQELQFETLEQSEYGNQEIEVTKEMILNVLVQASFQQRDFINERWQLIKKKYLNIASTAFIASILADGIPVAMSSNGIVVAYNHLPQVNKARKKRYMNQIIKFIQMITNHEYVIFPVLANDFNQYRNEYLQLRQAQMLPKPQPIVPLITPLEEKNNKEETKEEKLKNLFGNKFIGDQ